MKKNLDIRTLETAKEAPDNPYELFNDWFTQAEEYEDIYPNAMCLATCTKDGRPSARIVLLKDHDERGFVFYTNKQSNKGEQLAITPFAALTFHWKTLELQIRIEGAIEHVSDTEADTYFKTRHPGSRIGAWASQQSRELASRTELSDRVKAAEEQYKDNDDIPRPPHWSGYRVVPDKIEFWHEGAHRLHTRLVYAKDGINWSKTMLNP